MFYLVKKCVVYILGRTFGCGDDPELDHRELNVGCRMAVTTCLSNVDQLLV